MKKYLLTFLVLAAISSCKKDSATSTPDNSRQIIQDYIKVKGLESVVRIDSSGSDWLYFIVEKQGTGDSIKNRKNVKIYFKGYHPENDSVYFVATGGNPDNFVDSVYFQQTYGTAYNCVLSQQIKGWQIGIPFFKEGAEGTSMQGGSGTLIVPSKLAYNDGKVLIFDIKIELFY